MRVRLGDYIHEYSVRNRLLEDIPVYSVTNTQGFCTDYFGKEVASKDKSTYKIVPYGYFAYNPSRINVGSVDWQHVQDRVIVSPLYVVFGVSEQILPQYLYYYLKSDIALTFIKAVATGSVRDNLRFSALSELPIKLRPINEQQKIVDRLNLIGKVISHRQEELSSVDDLIKARFVEMFGDMLINPMTWPEQRLETVAEIVSGITKGHKVTSTELFEVPYMAVSNVKDGYIDWTTVKTIFATQTEIDQYRLMPEDVLMTEGGDPDKLGRGAIIFDPPQDCIHQNHIFRVRLDQDSILPVFMAQYLQHQRAKRYFLGCAKQTTGIASINMKQLRALPVLMPPIELQKQFAAFVAQVDKSKSAVQKSLEETQLLFDSLMQEYFG